MLKNILLYTTLAIFMSSCADKVDQKFGSVQFGNASDSKLLPTGPNSVYSPRGLGGGGAMSGLSISPFGNLWFVGTDMGTLFRSLDNGNTWVPVSHLQTTFNSNLAQSVSVGFSGDPMVVFHAQTPNVALRSEDAGVTWKRMTNLNLESGEEIKYFRGVMNQANLMYIGTTQGLWQSADKGINWKKVLTTQEKSLGTFVDDNGDIYTATEKMLYKSVDNGETFNEFYKPVGGFSLRGFTAGRDSKGLTLAILDNNGSEACKYALNYVDPVKYGQNVSNMDQVRTQMAACGHVWIGNEKAEFINTGKDGGAHLVMAENDSQTIYVTGHHTWARQTGTKVWKSTNAGQSWDLKLLQLDWEVDPFVTWGENRIEYSSAALDIGWWDSGYESFAINQRDSSVIGGTGFFFLFTSKNAGDFWNAPFTKYADVGPKTKGKKWISTGLEVNSVYRLKFHPKNPKIGYAAVADIAGMATEDGGKSFRVSKVKENSNYDYAFDPADDKVVFAVSGSRHDFPYNGSYFPVEESGGIFKSTDRGHTYIRMTPDNEQYNRQFLSIAYDASSKTIFAGSQGAGIAVSYDAGASWSLLNTGLPQIYAMIIPQIEVDPKTGDAYALLTGDATKEFGNQSKTGIYFLKKGTKQWVLLRKTVVTPENVMPNFKPWFYPTSFAIDFSEKSDRSTMYLTDFENNGNWLATGVWKSTDKGVTWKRVLQYTLPTSVIIDPKNSNNVYVSGKYYVDGSWGNGGAMYSNDGGKSWKRNDLLPLQANGYSATIDPNDPSKMFYTFFGGSMLYGPRPQ